MSLVLVSPRRVDSKRSGTMSSDIKGVGAQGQAIEERALRLTRFEGEDESTHLCL